MRGFLNPMARSLAHIKQVMGWPDAGGDPALGWPDASTSPAGIIRLHLIHSTPATRMNAAEDLAQPDTPAESDLSAWAAERLSDLMSRHGVLPRNQAALLSQVCGISISQARRKLRGAVWLFDEVLVMTRHFGVSLNEVFMHPDSGLSQGSGQAGHFLADGQQLPCELWPGALLQPDQAQPSLAACHDDQGWWVAAPAQLNARARGGSRYAVDRVVIAPEPKAQTRVAVLDDDVGAADALCDWFNASGYQAQPFYSARQMQDAQLDSFDAFVVDLMLAAGQTSHALIEQIRLAHPRAPILLLTGRLRTGEASEADLATMLRTLGVTFFEKPVRPAVLTAAIQSHIERETPMRAHG